MINNINYNIDDIAGEGPTQGAYARFEIKKETDHTFRFLPTPEQKATWFPFSRHWIDGKPVLSPEQDPEVNDPMTILAKWAASFARKLGKDHEDFPVFAGYPHRAGIASQCRLETLVAYNIIKRPDAPTGNPSQHYVFLPWPAHTRFWDRWRERKAMWARKGRECNPFHPEKGLDVQIGYHPDSVKDKRDTWSVSLDTDEEPIGVDGWEGGLYDLEEEVFQQSQWSNTELIAYCKNKFDGLLSKHAQTSVEEILTAAGWEFS